DAASIDASEPRARGSRNGDAASIDASEPRARSRPDGEESWVKRKAIELGLEHTVRLEGRPPERSKPGSRMINELRPRFRPTALIAESGSCPTCCRRFSQTWRCNPCCPW